MADELRSSGGSLFDFAPIAPIYEEWYSTPEGQSHDMVQQQDVLALIRSAQNEESLLDVGCGTGHWSRFFQTLGYKVQGIDVSREMILVAQDTVPECSFEVANACNLPFPDTSFDVTASITALEFIPDQAAAVKEMARCTRPGGDLLIGTLNRIAPINMDRMDKGEEPFASGHLLGPEELMELVSPWGDVRMVATGVADPIEDPIVVDTDQLSVSQEHLVGPLLVAHVRRRV